MFLPTFCLYEAWKDPTSAKRSFHLSTECHHHILPVTSLATRDDITLKKGCLCSLHRRKEIEWRRRDTENKAVSSVVRRPWSFPHFVSISIEEPSNPSAAAVKIIFPFLPFD